MREANICNVTQIDDAQVPALPMLMKQPSWVRGAAVRLEENN